MSSLCEWSSRQRVKGVLTMPSERLVHCLERAWRRFHLRMALV